MVLETRRTTDALELELTGEWRTLAWPQFDAALTAVDPATAPRIRISTARLTGLDLAGAWRLREFIAAARRAGSEVEFSGEPPDALRLLERTGATEAAGPAVSAPGAAAPTAPPAPAPGKSVLQRGALGPLAAVGRNAALMGEDGLRALAFLGRLSTTFARSIAHPRVLRPISITRHLQETGLRAIPIVALIAFLISVIIAYMSAQQLRNFGAEIYVVDLVTIGVLRELGVLLTAIIVAGRSGSAFAAELGSMRLNEEVDALYATGVDPFEALVLPRVLGIVLALPLLTVISDLVGLTGGAVLCRALLQMPLDQYVNRVSQAIAPTTFWVGLMKAPVFAVLVALSGCQRGLQVRDSARELGRLTTVAVVQAIFLVILADALFAVLFMELDI